MASFSFGNTQLLPLSVSSLFSPSSVFFFFSFSSFIHLFMGGGGGGGGILTLAAAATLSSKVALSGRPLVSLSVYRPFRLPTCEHGKTISHSAYTIPNF